MRRDLALRQDVLSSDMITADGAGIVLAARASGSRLPGRVAGIDLMAPNDCVGCARWLSSLPAWRPSRSGRGGSQGAGGPASQGSRLQDGGMAILIFRGGGGGRCRNQRLWRRLPVRCPTDPDEGALRFAQPGPPECARGHGRGRQPGRDSAAASGGPPCGCKRAGLEWFYRLLQEPRRMAGRYLRTNAVLALWLMAALAASRGRPAVSADRRRVRRREC